MKKHRQGTEPKKVLYHMNKLNITLRAAGVKWLLIKLWISKSVINFYLTLKTSSIQYYYLNDKEWKI